MIVPFIRRHLAKLHKCNESKYIRASHVLDCYKIIEIDATLESMIIELNLEFIIMRNDISMNWINANPSVSIQTIKAHPDRCRIYINSNSIHHRELKQLIYALWDYR